MNYSEAHHLPIHQRRAGAWLAAFATPACIALWFLLSPSRLILADLRIAVTGLFVLTCAYTDLRFRKIPNWATYPAALWALAINGLAALSQEVSGGASPEGVGLSDSLLGGFVCFFVMTIVYNLAQGGAGDVKLAAALGLLLGLRDGLLVISITFVLAGVALTGWSIWKHGPFFFVRALLKQVGSLLLPLWIDGPSGNEQRLLAKPVPLGAFFALATMFVWSGIRL